jgi:nicotinate-nucleotide adenylyltransferase
MNKKRTIGLFGGTFDPIHNGHLRAAFEIYEQLALDEMRLIPCKHPPHRATPIASEKDRLNMVKLAIQGTPLQVDEREMHRPGPSYSVDTLESLRREYPDASLCLVIGANAFLGLPSWHEWEKLTRLANIIILCRSEWIIPLSGTVVELIEKQTLQSNEKLAFFAAGKILKHEITSIDISASMIRTLIQSGRAPYFLQPNTVSEYIQHHNLYALPQEKASI